ncbi:prevent-host-death protein [Caulobacter sp. B11]|uniref:type II toxin-antitoxin system Phd/YefM family antitoxin n=1 Tax=Caulobacter sp. B11 TaxID=2048899 RepID=UPI000C12CA14|nr:prevent-host-death protein [Caulobacter sp. B11]PHY13029.1 prevent-host-death protein [Caulobacter sp. B11]
MADDPTPVGVRALRENLSDYLRQVRSGASFTVMSRGEAVAELRAPVTGPKVSRQPGLLKGHIVMADDFDIWPDDLLDAFEGRGA